jgi:hypothetical protein
VVVNGRLSERDDVDTFAVSLTAGQTLVAALTANQVFGAPMDAVLQLVSPRGFVIEQNDDYRELDPGIVFTAPADGTYFVRTFAFPSEPNQSIRFHNSADCVYRLTLTTGPYADHAWPLAVSESSQQHVQLEGWNLGENFRDVALTQISAGFGEFFDDGLANSAVARVVSHPTAVESQAAGAQLPALDVPISVSGRIAQPGEVDEYVFNAETGQTLEFQIESRELGFPLDPVLSLFGPDGKVLREADDAASGNEDATLSQQIGQAGQYRVRVVDRFGGGGPRHVYLLTARTVQPDCQLTVAADAFTLAADKPLEIDVAVNRVSGFAGELTISAVNLPAGVTAQPVVSQNDGDTSKSVKLALQAGAGIERPGTFRIIGTTAGEAPREITARATLAAFKTQVTDLWLNVPNPKLPKHPVEAKRPS